MAFEIIPAAEIPLAEQARVTNRAFAGYVAGWAELNAETLARFLCLQGADLCYSRFVRTERGLDGFAYITRTGNVPRLAAMALREEARGTGAARHLMLHVIEEAIARGDRAMMLEVIEQNSRAHAFYLRHGFESQGRLTGWRRPGGVAVGDSDDAVVEMPIVEALKLPVAVDYPTLPWQISRHAGAKLQGARAFVAGQACIIINQQDAGWIRVHSLLSGEVGWGDLRRAMAGVFHRFPDREFFAPPLFAEEFGAEIFQPLGFVRESLSQFLMRREL